MKAYPSHVGSAPLSAQQPSAAGAASYRVHRHATHPAHCGSAPLRAKPSAAAAASYKAH